MTAFEQVNDTPTAAFPVVRKAVAADSWTLLGIYATEAEADLAAAAAVDVPANNYAARVCKPVGNLYQDAE